MYKPRAIGQFRVMTFFQDHFHLDDCLVWPVSRNAMLLEDQNGSRVAFAYEDNLIYECDIPAPGTYADLRMFAEYLRYKCPDPRQQTFDAKTRLWLNAPIGIRYEQALGLNDELFRHYLTHPVPEKEEILLAIASGKISADTYRSIQLWYLNGHTMDTRLVIAGVDGFGPFADLEFHCHSPAADLHRFYITED